MFAHLLPACMLAMFITVAAVSVTRAQESFVATHFSVPEGHNEVPEVVGDAGYAVGVMRFDPASSSLEYRVTAVLPSGQNITMAHFHRGAPGVSGPPIHTINFAAGNMTASGTWSGISGEDLIALLNGDVYLNIHTNINQNGQLRDQVHMIPNLTAVEMRKGEETGTVTGAEDAVGNALSYLDEPGRRLIYIVDWSDLTGPPTMAHFHRGAKGESGPPIHTITIPTGATTRGMTRGVWENLTDTDISDLKSGRIYANIHTSQNQPGEIRGQMLTSEFYTAFISPANEVGQVTGSNAAGTGFATISGGRQLRAFFIIDGGTSPPSMAHIHMAPKGENGDIVFHLSSLAILGYPGIWGSLADTVTPQQNNAFMSSNMYANFHTTANPNGEARGQLIPSASNINRASSSVPLSRAGSGAVLASWYDASTGMIHIRANDPETLRDASVAIFSPLGTRVATLPVHEGSGTAAAGTMPAGIYFMQLLNNGASIGTGRVAVVR